MTNIEDEERNAKLGLENLPSSVIQSDVWLDLDCIQYFHANYNEEEERLPNSTMVTLHSGSIIELEIEPEELADLILAE